MPEQQQIAFSIGPLSVPAQTFEERTFYTWNSVAPRIGMIYDFAGDGRTVVKASYGLYWHNNRSGNQRGRQPEPEREDRHLQLGRPERRPPLSVG